jgi:hypothetical protein
MAEQGRPDEHEVNPREEDIQLEVEFFVALVDPGELHLIDPRNMALNNEQTRLSIAETNILQRELHMQFEIDPTPTPIRRYVADVAPNEAVVVQVLQTNQSDMGIYLHESTSTDRPFWAIGSADEEIQEFPEI